MLKSAEGISDFITLQLRKLFSKNILNKIAYKLIEKDISKLKNQVNPEIYNGATLIGLIYLLKATEVQHHLLSVML